MADKTSVLAKLEEFLGELRAHLEGVVASMPDAAARVETAAADVAAAAPAIATAVEIAAPEVAPVVAAGEAVVEDAAQAVERVAAPEAAPAATPEPGFKYVVVNVGDTLDSLAKAADLGNPSGDLYDPNMDTIETAARAAGHPSSNGGEILVPGTVLKYR